jgi:hypothetical protein
MAYKHYTKCYQHDPTYPPLSETELYTTPLEGMILGAVLGVIVGALVGSPGGPPGYLIGVFVGIFGGTALGMMAALDIISRKWLDHRLICLSGRRCAVGAVAIPEKIGELGDMDNDEFFDIALMPYPPGAGFQYTDPDSLHWRSNVAGRIADANLQPHLDANPANDPYLAPLQGDLVRPNDTILDDLSYDRTSTWLHCEAEGDFWVRIQGLIPLIGVLTGAGTAVAAAAAVVGFSLGCEIGGIFGPIGCLILGLILGALFALAAAFAAEEVLRGVVEGEFEADQGDIEDANVGDSPLGPLKEGDRLAVIGIHVFDGLHEGWNEIHPLMAVVRIPEPASYLEWNPAFVDGGAIPPPLDDFTGDAAAPLTAEDIRQGLGSATFLARATALRDRWCQFLSDAFEEPVREAQQEITHAWTIHPLVDGCAEPEPEPPR